MIIIPATFVKKSTLSKLNIQGTNRAAEDDFYERVRGRRKRIFIAL